ncbi:MAG: cadherin repeat domain-containing protein [Flavobacteriaceae bacterium]|nr:cadherin repeat domain-containing protein [Flavobacteriaceae bacterium]
MKKIILIVLFLAIVYSCQSDDSGSNMEDTEDNSSNENENNEEEIFDLNLEFVIDENPQNDQSIGILTVENSEGESSYTIISEEHEGAINLDTSTGEVTVADRSFFDFEQHTQLEAVYEYTDNLGTRMINLIINISDIVEEQLILDYIERFWSGTSANFIFESNRLKSYHFQGGSSGCSTELEYEGDRIVFIDYNCGGSPGWGVYSDIWLTYNSNNEISNIETSSYNTELGQTFVQYFNLVWSGNRLDMTETISGDQWEIEFDDDFKVLSYIYNGIITNYTYSNSNLIEISSSNGFNAHLEFDTANNPLKNPLYQDLVWIDLFTHLSWGYNINIVNYYPDHELTNTNNVVYRQLNNSTRYYEYDYNPNNYPVIQWELDGVKFREYYYIE